MIKKTGFRKIHGIDNPHLIFAFPFLFIGFCVLLKLTANNAYAGMVREDGIIETPQLLIYLAASILAGASSAHFAKERRRIHSLLYGFFAVGLLAVAMEEISWGQRILGIHSPAFFMKHNVQGEITLHNLDSIQDSLVNALYITVGFYGSSAWIAVRRLTRGRRNAPGWFAPEWFLASYFFPVFMIYTYFRIGIFTYWRKIDAFPIGGYVIWRDQEPAEFLLALGFLLFTVSIFRRQRAVPSSELRVPNRDKRSQISD